MAAGVREPHRERGENFFPRCALIGGMHGTSNADWWDARATWQLTPLAPLRLSSRGGSLERHNLKWKIRALLPFALILILFNLNS